MRVFSLLCGDIDKTGWLWYNKCAFKGAKACGKDKNSFFMLKKEKFHLYFTTFCLKVDKMRVLYTMQGFQIMLNFGGEAGLRK